MASQKRTTVIILSIVGAVVLLVAIIAIAAAASGTVRLGVLNCSAQVQRLEQDTKNEATAFRSEEFLTIDATSDTEVTKGGDCVSNPATVTLSKTYAVNSNGSTVIDDIEQSLAENGLSLDRKRSIYYLDTSLCNESYANLETTAIPNATHDNDFYTITLSSRVDCATSPKYEKGTLGEYEFEPVTTVQIERRIRF